MKFKNLFLSLSLIVAIGITTNAQEKQVRKVSDFSGISVSEGIKVKLSMSDHEKVEVIAPAKYINKVMTEVKNNELNIYLKGINNNVKNKKIEVLVNAKKINSIDVGSGASVKTTNSIENTNELDIDASSGASVLVHCNVQKTDVDASSGATITIDGQTQSLDAEASSGAIIKASELKSASVDADVSSGANIKIHVTKKLEAEASSGGTIKYSGTPEFVDIEKSSGGSVRKK